MEKPSGHVLSSLSRNAGGLRSNSGGGYLAPDRQLVLRKCCSSRATWRYALHGLLPDPSVPACVNKEHRGRLKASRVQHMRSFTDNLSCTFTYLRPFCASSVARSRGGRLPGAYKMDGKG